MAKHVQDGSLVAAVPKVKAPADNFETIRKEGRKREKRRPEVNANGSNTRVQAKDCRKEQLGHHRQATFESKTINCTGKVLGMRLVKQKPGFATTDHKRVVGQSVECGCPIM